MYQWHPGNFDLLSQDEITAAINNEYENYTGKKWNQPLGDLSAVIHWFAEDVVYKEVFCESNQLHNRPKDNNGQCQLCLIGFEYFDFQGGHPVIEMDRLQAGLAHSID